VEQKNGSRQLLARRIVITSLYHPYKLFENQAENGSEMLGRITSVIETKKHPCVELLALPSPVNYYSISPIKHLDLD
jgi:hypothetical protein